MKNSIIQKLVLGLCLAVAFGSSRADATPADGTVIGATKIFDNGPDADRFNLVLIAEGYQDSELSDFAQHAEQFLNFFLATPPFDANCRAFNIWRIDVSSTDSGADDPESPADDPDTEQDESIFCGSGTGAEVNTYFDATFCSDSKIRRLLGVNNGTAIDVLNTEVPEWDQALVIVNSTIYGGQGGTPGTTSLSGTWENIAIHEIGHSAFGLADEYEYFAGCNSGETDRDNHPAVEPVQPNVTIETDPTLVKWKDLILPLTDVPTTENADCSMCDPQPNLFPGDTVVGLYEGAHYYHCDSFRPVFNCMMRNFAAFCPVCTRRIVETLQPFQPTNLTPVCDAGGPYVEECSGNLTNVMLDGTGSSDEGCKPLTFMWTGLFVGGATDGYSPTVQFMGPGMSTVDLDVSDGSLNAQCDTTVTIQDTIPPQITAPADVSVTCTAAEGTPVALGTPTTNDICDSNVEVQNDAPLLFPLGDTTVTWTAEDDSGNETSDVQTVTVSVSVVCVKGFIEQLLADTEAAGIPGASGDGMIAALEKALDRIMEVEAEMAAGGTKRLEKNLRKTQEQLEKYINFLTKEKTEVAPGVAATLLAAAEEILAQIDTLIAGL